MLSVTQVKIHLSHFMSANSQEIKKKKNFHNIYQHQNKKKKIEFITLIIREESTESFKILFIWKKIIFVFTSQEYMKLEG